HLTALDGGLNGNARGAVEWIEEEAASADAWTDPLLDGLLTVIGRYIVMTPAQRLVVALWIIHTYLVGLLEQTAYLTVTSPVRQCGKTRLLELFELTVPRPWPAVTPSEAVVYRTVHARMPTLLLDEVDAIFAPKTADRHEGLRAILNAGHRRGATVPRCIGVSSKPQDFNVYCAKVLAGIGVLPDTITDRSIPIRLARKRRSEEVERFRRREAKQLCDPLKAELERWAEEHGATIAAARPPLPDELSDRMQEGCEPLLAIADRLGCGLEAREALVELLTEERLDERENAQEKLLRDVRHAFVSADQHVLPTESLLATLNADEPWSTWYGNGLDARGLATLLRPYGITSRTVRVGDETPKGYRRADLEDAWTRYLKDEPWRTWRMLRTPRKPYFPPRERDKCPISKRHIRNTDTPQRRLQRPAMRRPSRPRTSAQRCARGC
ncbi:MAG TPA: DUF3631 domain-containing protein, partial [Gaiellaceae bacterium]|nr:DUF3631 domain-containing protein [Gaiellaceae bacterium]